MKPRLLLLTPELPYPLQSGGKVKTWNMLCALAERWEITMVCPLKESDPDWVEEFQRKAPIESLVSTPVRVPRSAVNLLKSYAKAQPLNLLRTYSSTLADYVHHHAGRFDLVLVDHFEVFQYLPQSLLQKPRDQRPPVIYHAHNAYHQIWQRYGERSLNPINKLVCSVEARRVMQYERQVVEKADLVFAAPNDIKTLAGIGCDSAKFRETLHLGDDENLEKPALTLSPSRNKLCYAGFLGWEPNVQGLLWFLRHVWPLLKSTHPNLRFDIAGKNPDARLIKAVQNAPDVELLGFVEDLEDLYRDSRVAVCPLQFGSGIKVKVANGMARGIPVVTTTVGAEGLDVTHGKHLMIADSAEDTFYAVDKLLMDDQLWQQMSEESRWLMIERYTWKALFARMHQEIDALLASTSV